MAGRQQGRHVHYSQWANSLVGTTELSDIYAVYRTVPGWLMISLQQTRSTAPSLVASPLVQKDSGGKTIWECCQLCRASCIFHPDGSKTVSPHQESQRGDKRKRQMTDFKWGFPNLHGASTFITPPCPNLLRGLLALFLFLRTTPTVLSILLNTLFQEQIFLVWVWTLSGNLESLPRRLHCRLPVWQGLWEASVFIPLPLGWPR